MAKSSSKKKAVARQNKSKPVAKGQVLNAAKKTSKQIYLSSSRHSNPVASNSSSGALPPLVTTESTGLITTLPIPSGPWPARFDSLPPAWVTDEPPPPLRAGSERLRASPLIRTTSTRLDSRTISYYFELAATVHSIEGQKSAVIVDGAPCLVRLPPPMIYKTRAPSTWRVPLGSIEQQTPAKATDAAGSASSSTSNAQNSLSTQWC